MDSILEFKGRLQNIYANYSGYIDRLARFVLALIAFYAINHQIGYMHVLTSPAVTLGLSAVCAFLPPVVIVLLAAVLVLGHVYAVSLGMLIVTAAVFLLMYIFYLRLAPKTATVVLISAIACMFKIPSAAAVGAALLGAPAIAAPVALGAVAYEVIRKVKSSAAAVQSAESGSFITDMTDFAPKLLGDKRMWLMVVAAVLCVLLVYSVRRSGIAHAWKAAGAAGAVVYLLVMAAGGGILGVGGSFGTQLMGAVAAIITALILELMFFSVDYARCENLQYEDDEYYYYVKAVPKVGVAAQEKTVKRIAGHEDGAATEVIDAGELRKRTKKPAARPDGKNPSRERKSGKDSPAYVAPERRSGGRSGSDLENTDHLLLTRSLQRELNLDGDKDED